MVFLFAMKIPKNLICHQARCIVLDWFSFAMKIPKSAINHPGLCIVLNWRWLVKQKVENQKVQVDFWRFPMLGFEENSSVLKEMVE